MGFETFEQMLGSTVTKIDQSYDEMIFTLSTGEIYKLYHSQNCCESVTIEDVIGDLNDLIGSPLLMVEEVSNSDDRPSKDDTYLGSYTWTFYKMATAKGYVTIRWYGESNGYYSESVDFAQVK